MNLFDDDKIDFNEPTPINRGSAPPDSFSPMSMGWLGRIFELISESDSRRWLDLINEVSNRWWDPTNPAHPLYHSHDDWHHSWGRDDSVYSPSKSSDDWNTW